MKRVTLLLAFFLLTTCAAYKAQHSGLDANTTRTEEAAATVSPDPAILAAFEAQPLGMKQAILLSEIDKYREQLHADGKYDCCVKPACRQCALTAGECHCRQVITADGPCCGECTQAWVDGRGDTAGIDRERVLEHLGCVRALYEKKTPEGMTPPGRPVKNQ